MYQRPRSAVRIQAAVPVVLDRGSGTTENFSYAGVYFVSDQSYSPGDCIPFTLVLGATVTDPPMLLECYGCVVRVEPRGTLFGTAVTIDSFWITSSDQKKRGHPERSEGSPSSRRHGESSGDPSLPSG